MHPDRPRSATAALPPLRLFVSLLLFLALTASGQVSTGRLSGLVTNRDGSAFLEGAIVALAGTGRAVLTDRRGEFDFGTGLRLRSGQVPGFIPRAWNVVGEYTRGRFFMLARYNQQSAFPVGTTADPRLQAIAPRREKIDVNFGYRWRRSCEVFFAIDNITERPSHQWLGEGERRFSAAVWADSRRFNFGIQGTF